MMSINETPSMDRPLKGLKRIPWPLKILVGLVMLYVVLVAIGATLIVADPVERVNAIVVLSGDDGDRLDLAIYMLEKDFVSNLVLTNTGNEANRALRSEAIEGGFNPDRIYLTEAKVEIPSLRGHERLKV